MITWVRNLTSRSVWNNQKQMPRSRAQKSWMAKSPSHFNGHFLQIWALSYSSFLKYFKMYVPIVFFIKLKTPNQFSEWMTKLQYVQEISLMGCRLLLNCDVHKFKHVRRWHQQFFDILNNTWFVIDSYQTL